MDRNAIQIVISFFIALKLSSRVENHSDKKKGNLAEK